MYPCDNGPHCGSWHSLGKWGWKMGSQVAMLSRIREQQDSKQVPLDEMHYSSDPCHSYSGPVGAARYLSPLQKAEAWGRVALPSPSRYIHPLVIHIRDGFQGFLNTDCSKDPTSCHTEHCHSPTLSSPISLGKSSKDLSRPHLPLCPTSCLHFIYGRHMTNHNHKQQPTDQITPESPQPLLPSTLHMCHPQHSQQTRPHPAPLIVSTTHMGHTHTYDQQIR